MTRRITSPVVNAETKAFWDAARQNRFLIPVCTACGKAHWYPRAICPFCACDKIAWRQASGRGTIYTYSVMRRVPKSFGFGVDDRRRDLARHRLTPVP